MFDYPSERPLSPGLADLEQGCQWLSSALHDQPAQELFRRRLCNPQDTDLESALEAMCQAMRWLRNPILEGCPLSVAVEDWIRLQGYSGELKLNFAGVDNSLQKELYRIFQELAELRLPLGPERIFMGLRVEGQAWQATWKDDAQGTVELVTIPARLQTFATDYKVRRRPFSFKVIGKAT